MNFVAGALLPTAWGDFSIHGFEDASTGKEHVALVMGDLSAEKSVLCRVHSECLTGDAFFSLRCDCGPQLQYAMEKIAEQGSGIILYLRQEGRGIGLLNKIKAYELQDFGADTVEANEQLGFLADGREYEICRPMLAHFGVTQVRLMTNNPSKVDGLESIGIKISERVPIHIGHNVHNKSYLAIKASKMGHLR